MVTSIDDRSNSTNPGGTDVFGRAPPARENPGVSYRALLDRLQVCGARPALMRVGADRWAQDQAYLVSDDEFRALPSLPTLAISM